MVEATSACWVSNSSTENELKEKNYIDKKGTVLRFCSVNLSMPSVPNYAYGQLSHFKHGKSAVLLISNYKS